MDLISSHTTAPLGGHGADAEEKQLSLEVDDIIPGKGKGLVVLLYGKEYPKSPCLSRRNSILRTLQDKFRGRNIDLCRPSRSRKDINGRADGDCYPETTIFGQRRGRGHRGQACGGQSIKNICTGYEVARHSPHVSSTEQRTLVTCYGFSLQRKANAIDSDEADVFLESRGRGAKVQSADKNALVSGKSSSRVQRRPLGLANFNAVDSQLNARLNLTFAVTVFLRVLEYYHGIMFLTTNQIASFDIAIVSRIHVAIRYESLGREQTEDIFRNFLDKLAENNLIDNYNERDGVLDWLEDTVYKEGLDGRQIRNIVTTALGLARAAKEDGDGDGKLAKEHLKRAFDNINSFKNDFKLQMQRYKDSQDKMIK